MRFLNLVDTDGKRHVVNPLHITAIHEADVGCVVLLRGRDSSPILLNMTVEVMGDALNSYDLDRESILAAN